MEDDYEITLLNAIRDTLHSQLMLHAKGLEAFTKAMQLLPPVPHGMANASEQ